MISDFITPISEDGQQTWEVTFFFLMLLPKALFLRKDDSSSEGLHSIEEKKEALRTDSQSRQGEKM